MDIDVEVEAGAEADVDTEHGYVPQGEDDGSKVSAETPNAGGLGGLSDNVDPCSEKECGPAPLAPNFLCPDGETWAGPGACELQDDDTCGWTFVECPTCCYDEAPLCFEGATCCGDGTWACNDPWGISTCDFGDKGKPGVACSCCTPGGGDLLGCYEGASCCGDGTWACNDGWGNSTCDTKGVECEEKKCEDDGASCAGGESCCDGLQCCSGVPVPPGSEYCSTLCPISDRNRKENFEPLDTQAVLAHVVALPLTSWNYKFEDPSIRHMGPMAQDFKASFRVGSTDKAIYTVDADGVALASIKALNDELVSLRTENDALESALERVQSRLDALEAK